MHPRNVTGLVDALVGAGFVALSSHPTDRCAVLVSLTDDGARLVAGWRADRDHGEAHLFRGISGADLATFVAVLDLVLGNVRTTYQVE